jgi:hypothetical protein
VRIAPNAPAFVCLDDYFFSEFQIFQHRPIIARLNGSEAREGENTAYFMTGTFKSC